MRLFKSPKILLLIILIVTFLLRIVDISNNPPAMYGDELTMVYDVYSIIHTGQDQLGNFLPLNFEMGGGRPVGYGYFSIPFVFLFGTSALAIRLLSILSGVGLVWAIYYLGKRLFSQKIGLVAAALLAISPWDISMSRGGYEAHFALFLSVAGVILFLQAAGKKWFYALSALSFGLAIHTYSTYKLTIPVFISLLFWFGNFKSEIKKAGNRLPLIFATFFTGIALCLIFAQAFLIHSEARFLSINAFSQNDLRQTITQKINFDLNTSGLPNNISKLFHNKFDEYAGVFVENYLKNFSMDFLFLHGDGNPRHNMATTGEFYAVELTTMLLGFGFLWKKQSWENLQFLLGWLGIGPIAATLLLQQHALRASFMLPPLVIISAVGVVFVWESVGLWRFVKYVLAAGFIIQFLLFTERLYFVSPNQFGRFWSVPAKQAAQMAIENGRDFDYVILSDQIDNMEFAYPVYAQSDPRIVIEQNRQRSTLDSYQFKKIANVYIGHIAGSDIEKFISDLPGSVLYIGTPSDQVNLTNYETVAGQDKQTQLVLKRKIK